ncbi:hypothetical protein PIB30_023969 [Stylosanthes scabra]|uniref:PB1-like domain-containing protein n=1 Tax=Stylosanthes scabra TaxID=79078 RepID=A0ABU6XBB1_9FABA|nr:hypothetical protein [Stylosanthes scabra]
MSYYVVPVLHNGGKLGRVGDGTLHYMGGTVKWCEPMDVNLINHKDMEKLGKGVGCLQFKESGFNDMCDFTLNNNLTELHIYFEHPVDKPIITKVSTESSSSSDSYESADDEVYKPPPPGYESDDSNQIQMCNQL